jgi:radical SAM protein with 4Fe4S-binding SPASM domain
MLAHWCGAVAVSHYGKAHQDNCFNTVGNLTWAGLKQVNIHKLLSQETLDECFELITAAKTDPRLKGLKAIVFLLLKPKGERNRLHPIESLDSYKRLLDHARDNEVAVGMDSCSAPMALRTLPSECVPSIEPCESTLFSIYVNVDGEMFPCSFTEGTPGWEQGIDLTCDDCGTDPYRFWHHPRLEAWRDGLLNSSLECLDCSVQPHCRSCPVYDITVCQPKPSLADKLVKIGGAR